MVKLTSTGSFKNSYRFLQFLNRREYFNKLNQYGQRGVAALSKATPKDTGKTAASWRYEIDTSINGLTISWINDNVVGHTPLVIMLQYGHGTRGGGYVKGKDFINPSIKPIFEEIEEDVWKEVTAN